MAPIAPPLITGNYYDFSSIQILVATARIKGFKSINYTSEQAPGDVYGTAAQKIGRTRGQHKASGSFELYRPEFNDLQIALQGVGGVLQPASPNGSAPGLFEVGFPIVVSFAENPPLGVSSPILLPTQTDTIIGARITKVD